MDEGNKITTSDPISGPNMAKAQSGGSKMMLWLILAVVLVLLVIGGVYYYLNSNKPAAPAEGTPAQTTKVQENLEENLNSINISDEENDFTSVDSDIQGL